MDDLFLLLGGLAKSTADRDLLEQALHALESQYDLAQKLAREPGLNEILQQLTGRLAQAYGSFSALQGKRILDIACGSNTSKAPSFIFVNTPFGESRIPILAKEGYTAQFEPWFCRILLELGADPVGIDRGDLESESFEHYPLDLGQPGVLDFLPYRSFDAVHDSRLFGSPEFTAQFPKQPDRLRIAAEIWRQEQRLLKSNGKVIHSDAAVLAR
jgi:hypothetical protein